VCGRGGRRGTPSFAEIAERHLSPAARAGIADLLGPGVSLASISTWADDVRTERPETFNWHFVDIPLNAAHYDAARDCRPDPERGHCVIAAVARFRAELSDARATLQTRREALKYLVHFIADLHQPLHTVLEDRGGNDLHVRFFVRPSTPNSPSPSEDTNLHSVWDGGLIRHCVYDWNAYVAHLENDWIPRQDISKLSQGTVVEWVEQSHRAAKEVAYTAPPNANLGEDYVARAVPVLDRQLAVAGLRLARVLNEVFGAGARVYPSTAPRESVARWYCKAGD
jgi:nuclease S1